MRSYSLRTLAVFGMVLCSATTMAQIQQVGHAECAVPECAAPCLDSCGSVEGCNNCIGYQSCDWSSAGSGCNHCDVCSGFGSCQMGNCLNGMCNGQGMGCQSCLSNSALGRFCATKAYPDSGWAPPARVPVNRDRIWYGSYYPQAFYGSPGGGFVANYPQVYQPTDTTQLGYSYANVPTWQHRPGMIPSAPVPSQYHSRVCPGGSAAHCNCQSGGFSHHGYVQPAGYASQQWTASPAVAYRKPQIVRPPVADSGSSSRNWFRLSSLTDLFD